MGPKIGQVEVFKLKEVSDKLGIGVRTLIGYVKKKKLKANKIGKDYFVTEKNLLDFIEGSRGKGK